MCVCVRERELYMLTARNRYNAQRQARSHGPPKLNPKPETLKPEP